MLSGTGVERKKDPFKNIETTSLVYVKTASRKWGCRAERAGSPATSGTTRCSPGDHLQPLQTEPRDWQDKVFTGRDQKQWKEPE